MIGGIKSEAIVRFMNDQERKVSDINQEIQALQRKRDAARKVLHRAYEPRLWPSDYDRRMDERRTRLRQERVESARSDLEGLEGNRRLFNLYYRLLNAEDGEDIPHNLNADEQEALREYWGSNDDELEITDETATKFYWGD